MVLHIFGQIQSTLTSYLVEWWILSKQKCQKMRKKGNHRRPDDGRNRPWLRRRWVTDSTSDCVRWRWPDRQRCSPTCSGSSPRDWPLVRYLRWLRGHRQEAVDGRRRLIGRWLMLPGGCPSAPPTAIAFWWTYARGPGSGIHPLTCGCKSHGGCVAGAWLLEFSPICLSKFINQLEIFRTIFLYLNTITSN